jgi:GMP synthase (glutamine-hydrolysing)
MKTLIVNSYHAEAETKILPYVELVKKFSEYEVIPDVKLLTRGEDIYDYDCLILSGSPAMISKGCYSHSYLAVLQTLSLPTLGICYGHQILAFAHGAKVRGGEEIRGEEIVTLLDFKDIFKGLPPQIRVYESHQEYVDPENLEGFGFLTIATSSRCSVEAIRHITKPLYGVQFHIERSGLIGEKILENFYKEVVVKRRTPR